MPDDWELMLGHDNDSLVWLFRSKELNDIFPVTPRYYVGETVYIKEAWRLGAYNRPLKTAEIIYRADLSKLEVSWNGWLEKNTRYGGSAGTLIDEFDRISEHRWRSPMFLPELCARDFIKITDVRPERLQDITEEDARAEGILSDNEEIQKAIDGVPDTGGVISMVKPIIMRFASLWDSINGKTYPWDSNCWVWRYCFELNKER